MKKSFTIYEKYLSIQHYLVVLRRAPVHMQHVYAVFFAGVVTAALASVILYFDYGFWHDTYSRTEIVEKRNTVDQVVVIHSPSEMIEDFFKEASDKIKTIQVSSSSLPTGKENYMRGSNSSYPQ